MPAEISGVHEESHGEEDTMGVTEEGQLPQRSFSLILSTVIQSILTGILQTPKSRTPWALGPVHLRTGGTRTTSFARLVTVQQAPRESGGERNHNNNGRR